MVFGGGEREMKKFSQLFAAIWLELMDFVWYLIHATLIPGWQNHMSALYWIYPVSFLGCCWKLFPAMVWTICKLDTPLRISMTPNLLARFLQATATKQKKMYTQSKIMLNGKFIEQKIIKCSNLISNYIEPKQQSFAAYRVPHFIRYIILWSFATMWFVDTPCNF